MRVIAISDLHGILPAIPPCDLLLIAGDVCPDYWQGGRNQAAWMDTELRAWLESIPAKHVVATLGNHDFVGQPGRTIPSNLHWTLLMDQGAVVAGKRIYGTPWTLRFGDWANMLPASRIAEKWHAIPADLDILIVHGPPADCGLDITSRGDRVGCDLLAAELAVKRPKLTVFGHIHESIGMVRKPYGVLANVSIVDEWYDLRSNAPLFNMTWDDMLHWHQLVK